MSEKVTIKKVYANQTKTNKTYYNVYLQGKEGSYTTWDKVKEGESYNVDIWQDGNYNKMKVSEEIPIVDVNADLQGKAKSLTTNHSIESQVIIKGTVDIVRAMIDKGFTDIGNIEQHIIAMEAKLTEAMLNAQKTLLKSDETEEITEPEPF